MVTRKNGSLSKNSLKMAFIGTNAASVCTAVGISTSQICTSTTRLLLTMEALTAKRISRCSAAPAIHVKALRLTVSSGEHTSRWGSVRLGRPPDVLRAESFRLRNLKTLPKNPVPKEQSVSEGMTLGFEVWVLTLQQHRLVAHVLPKATQELLESSHPIRYLATIHGQPNRDKISLKRLRS